MWNTGMMWSQRLSANWWTREDAEVFPHVFSPRHHKFKAALHGESKANLECESLHGMHGINPEAFAWWSQGHSLIFIIFLRAGPTPCIFHSPTLFLDDKVLLVVRSLTHAHQILLVWREEVLTSCSLSYPVPRSCSYLIKLSLIELFYAIMIVQEVIQVEAFNCLMPSILGLVGVCC